jgi:NAD-dependent SIR2 family protein deacetylase
VPVDLSTMRAARTPRCPDCGAVARPNILMFGDYGWVADRTYDQRSRFDAFAAGHLDERTVVIELGAGTFVPTIRHTSEQLGDRGGLVVRINPREPQIDAAHISMATGALEGLTAIDRAVGSASGK